MIKTQNIKVYKNTTISTSFIIKDEHNNVIDLTSLTGSFVAYLDTPGSNEDNVIENALTITDAEKGLCSVTLDDSDTDIDVANYIYKLVFTDTTDNFVYAYGILEVVGDDTERITEIKRKYGLTYDYYTLRSALNWARKQINDNAFENTKLNFYQKKTEFKVCNYIMDSNFDGVVDASDINIYQYLSKSPYTIEDLNIHIDSLIKDHPNGVSYIVMDDEYPSDNYKLVIEYKRGQEPLNDNIENIKLLEDLYTIYRLFEILEVNQLQRGLPDKSINGVSLSFDRQGIKEYKEQLMSDINSQLLKIIPFNECPGNMNRGGVSRSIQIPKSY